MSCGLLLKSFFFGRALRLEQAQRLFIFGRPPTLGTFVNHVVSCVPQLNDCLFGNRSFVLLPKVFTDTLCLIG
jgi:hypothetical protein